MSTLVEFRFSALMGVWSGMISVRRRRKIWEEESIAEAGIDRWGPIRRAASRRAIQRQFLEMEDVDEAR